MCADYRVYAQASRQSRAVVASGCAFFAYTGAYQAENIYKDGLYQKNFGNAKHKTSAGYWAIVYRAIHAKYAATHAGLVVTALVFRIAKLFAIESNLYIALCYALTCVHVHA